MGRLPALIALGLLAWPGSSSAGTVSGEVMGFPDGEPLAGIPVRARDAQGAGALGVTQADGSFTITGVDPGRVRVRADPPDDLNRLGAYAGDVSAFCAADVFELAPDGVVEGVRIELPVGGVIEGVLRDRDGVPVSGTVTAQGVGALESSVIRRATAGDDGVFSVVGLPSWLDADGNVLAGAYRLRAQIEDRAPFYAGDTWDAADSDPVPAVRGETTSRDLTEPPWASLRGSVVTPDGVPAVNAPVTVLAGSQGAAWLGVTDAAGEWVAEDVWGTDLRVGVGVPGFAYTWFGDAPARTLADSWPGSTSHDLGTLEVAPGRTVVLRLVGEDADLPLSGGVAGVVDVDGVVGRIPYPSVDFVDREATLEDVTRESLELTLRIPGYLDQLALVPAGGDAEVELALVRGTSVLAVVRDRTTGLPVRGALVRALAPGTDEQLGAALSDGDGRAEVVSLPVGDVVLQADWQPFCPADPGRTPVWSGGARDIDTADLVPTGTEAEVVFVLPDDRDRDFMDDVWELLWGLDPGRVDASEDPDADGASNIEEYRAGSDPLDGASTNGCSTAGSAPTWPPTGLGSVLALALAFVRRRSGR